MIDKLGLYVQANGDVGDSSHRTGLAASLLCMLGFRRESNDIIYNILSNLEISDGIYIRHPESEFSEWAHLPTNFSRDQASRVILAYAVNGNSACKSAIRRWLLAMAKRGFFHQNHMDPVDKVLRPPDIMSPGEWRNVIRGLDLWWAYPALLLLDLFFIGDIYFRKPWDGASLYVPDLKFALMKYWTPSAWIANKLNDRTPWLKEVLNNHAEENNGCVELRPLFEEIAKV